MKKKAIKNGKITKQSHTHKGSASTVDILNTFNPEIQLENTESAIKNKLNVLLPEQKGFKFVTILVLKFKKKERNH